MKREEIIILGSSISPVHDCENLDKCIQHTIISGTEGDIRVLAGYLYSLGKQNLRITFSGIESSDMNSLFNNLSIPAETFITTEQEPNSGSTVENLNNFPIYPIDQVITNLYHLPRVRFLAKQMGVVIHDYNSPEEILFKYLISNNAKYISDLEERIKRNQSIWNNEFVELRQFSPALAVYYFTKYALFTDDLIDLDTLIHDFSQRDNM